MKNYVNELLLIFMAASLILITRYQTKDTRYELLKAKEPVVVLDKEHRLFGWSVKLIDDNKVIYNIGNVSLVANFIGRSYNNGDTICVEAYLDKY